MYESCDKLHINVWCMLKVSFLVDFSGLLYILVFNLTIVVLYKISILILYVEHSCSIYLWIWPQQYFCHLIRLICNISF